MLTQLATEPHSATSQRLVVAEWRDFPSLQKILGQASAAGYALEDLICGCAFLNLVTNGAVLRKADDHVEYKVAPFDSFEELQMILDSHVGDGTWKVFKYIANLASLPSWVKEALNCVILEREVVEPAAA